MTINADFVRAWTDQLCRGAGGTEEIAAALGLAGSLVGDDRWVVVVPPPPGAAEVSLALLHGTVDYVVLRLVDFAVTYADLNARFGSGDWQPAMPPHITYHWMTFRFDVADAAFRCTISAAFNEYPAAASVATEVVLRRHRVYRPGQVPPGMDVMADRLRGWSEQLCTLRAGEPADVVATLGIAGSVVEVGSDCYGVRPLLPGTRDFRLCMYRGDVDYIEVRFLDSTVTRADLDARFGLGDPGVRLHPFNSHPIDYEVSVPGAPYRCRVFAYFPDEPTQTSVAESVTVRRDRAA